MIFGMLLALTGLPHGAVDPAIARHAGLWRGVPVCLNFLWATWCCQSLL